jgi:hypothetical protein
MNAEFDAELFADLDAGKTLRVSFLKSDHTERVMDCVKSPEIVGESYEYSGKERKEKENIVSVWDIEKGAWRSFHLGRVLGYEVLEEEVA